MSGNPIDAIRPLLEAKGWTLGTSSEPDFLQGSTGPAEKSGGITILTGIPFQVMVTEHKNCCSGGPELKVRIGGPGQLSTEGRVGSPEQAVFWLETILPAIEADLAKARARMKNPLRKVLTDHYLAGIECDHEAKTDKASCACSMVALPVCPSVGAAVQSWIDHVLSVLATV